VDTIEIEFARNAGPYSDWPFERGRVEIWHRDGRKVVADFITTVFVGKRWRILFKWLLRPKDRKDRFN